MTDSERIERLERRCRWLTRAVVGMALVVASAVAVAAQKPPSRFETIIAKRVLIEDETGKNRGVFGLGYEKDRMSLMLLHRGGKVAFSTHDGEDPYIILADPAGKELVNLPAP